MTISNKKKSPPMARPKKQRTFEGVVLADWLYADSRCRAGYWRYRRPDMSFKTFPASDVHQANKIAKHNNLSRDLMPVVSDPSIRGTLAAHLPEFILHRETQSPVLISKDSWKNRKYQLASFAKEIVRPLAQLRRSEIMHWWDVLTPHQQKARHAEFRKLFNWLMGRELLPAIKYNPFTLADDKPRLYKASTPERKSDRLTIEGFWLIYGAAKDMGYPCLQIAMGISLTTFMREGDICSLKLSDNLEDNLLKKVIGKSLQQKGNAKAARLQWDVGNYNLLRQLIGDARELSMKNRRCPYVLNHWPKRKLLGKTKEHIAQVLPGRLQEMFEDVRAAVGFTGPNPPTFHSVRSLANKIAKDAKCHPDQIKQANAHSSIETQKTYQEGHELPFETVQIQFTAEQIGGDFINGQFK